MKTLLVRKAVQVMERPICAIGYCCGSGLADVVFFPPNGAEPTCRCMTSRETREARTNLPENCLFFVHAENGLLLDAKVIEEFAASAILEQAPWLKTLVEMSS